MTGKHSLHISGLNCGWRKQEGVHVVWERERKREEIDYLSKLVIVEK